jgi:hypothetical protein
MFKNSVPRSKEETLRLHYKDQLFNAVYGNDRRLFWTSHETHKYTVSKLQLREVVHIVATVF